MPSNDFALVLNPVPETGAIDGAGARAQCLRFGWSEPQIAGFVLEAGAIVVSDPQGAVWEAPIVADGPRHVISPPSVVFRAWSTYDWSVRLRGTDADGAKIELHGESSFTVAPDPHAHGAEAAEAEWREARWIARTDRDELAAAPVLRRRFEVTSPLSSAHLLLAVGGIAHVELDGEPVGTEVLEPGTVHWDRRVPSVMRDLTERLGTGVHELTIELGRGFYAMTNGNVWAWERAPWHAAPSVRGVLRLVHADGRVEWIVTDASWDAQDGATLSDDLYAGESVDLRRRESHRVWEPVALVVGPRGLIEPRSTPPERRVREDAPVSVTEIGPGDWVVSFPHIISGWVRIPVPADEGRTVTLRYGERLHAGGRPNYEDEKGYFQGGFQTDTIILGAREHVTESRFSYKGFRHVRVTGWPANAGEALWEMRAILVHSDTEVRAAVEIDEPQLQWMHDAAVATMRNNLHDYPTDTPKYEKNGWTGDGMLGAPMLLRNLDTAAVLAKWVQDIAETVGPSGIPALIAPNAGVFGVDTVAPPWHAALVEVPWEIYLHTGDAGGLRTHWSTIRAYLHAELARSDDGIADTILGDWVAPGTDPGGANPQEDHRVPATAFLARMLSTASLMAEVIGEEGDRRAFDDAAARVIGAFRRTFHDRAAGVVRGRGESELRQTHQVLALAFGLLPEEDRAAVADALVRDVRARGDHLDTGALGTRWLLPVLTDTGHADAALAVARQTTVPSWGAWREAGATTMLEHWDLEARSHGHYFLGTVDDWLTEWVVGIRREEPGWRSFTVGPAFTADVPAARATIDTPYGRIAAGYRREGAEIVCDVTVPAGAEARVVLPGAPPRILRAGDHRVVASVP